MKRMTQILSLGLLLSISTVALAGNGHDRNHRDGYYDWQHHHASQHARYNNHRYGNRHKVNYKLHARRHSHHGRYCYDSRPRGYAEPRLRHGYSSPGLVIIYQPSERLYIGASY